GAGDLAHELEPFGSVHVGPGCGGAAGYQAGEHGQLLHAAIVLRRVGLDAHGVGLYYGQPCFLQLSVVLGQMQEQAVKPTGLINEAEMRASSRPKPHSVGAASESASNSSCDRS